MTYLRDPRHRFSYELRPHPSLDTALRGIAVDLEAAGLVEPGASAAPRFHPHLTFLRAHTARPGALTSTATALQATGGVCVTLEDPATFGSGRIIHVSPRERAAVRAAREALLAELEPLEVDPTASDRPWAPHVSLAYETVPGRTGDAIAHLASVVPIRGSWGSVECWDLSVRPTVLVHRIELAPTG